MPLDLAQAYDWIAAELQELQPIGESMRRVIDRCAAVEPHPHWRDLRRLPFDELHGLRDWIEGAFFTESPNDLLRGLWFGIANPVNDDDQPTADFYVSGTDRFDADPGSTDWAVNPIWRPESRYARSEIMASIYNIAYRDGGLGNDAEYALCLAYSAFAIRDLLNELDARRVLNVVGPVGVAIGFDSGDFLLLGRYTRDGLAPL